LVTGILDLTIGEARRLLLAGDVTSTDLTEATLRHIERTDQCLHAYATVTADLALDSARSADEEIRRGVSRGPLHGIPIGIKDLCHVQGVPTEAGSAALNGDVPGSDSIVVQRLRSGGAVIVGKTVTSEFAFGPTIRPTRNAWDQTRTPEGSSAGSAVAVAARSAYAAVGTDTAGSIRVPAGVNGVVGLKPTFGLVPADGVIPMSPSLDHVGPITRTVEDCAAVLSVLTGSPHRQTRDRGTEGPSARTELDLSDVRIGIERTHLPEPTIGHVAREAAEDAAATLEGLGATLVEVTIPELELAEACLVTIKAVEASAYHRERLRAAPDQYGDVTRAILQAGAVIPATYYAQAQRARRLVTRAVRETFRSHGLDALLGPGWGPATPMDLSDDVSFVPFTFPLRSSAVNLTGMPAISVPCGFTDDHIPLGGFELWGRPMAEATLLRMARAYEGVHEWYRRTPTIAATAEDNVG
jgi:aspartyl-tRNA(Asn)/glutamyl-tRNA(Gln) amidotransferase subunit A